MPQSVPDDRPHTDLTRSIGHPRACMRKDQRTLPRAAAAARPAPAGRAWAGWGDTSDRQAVSA